MKLKTILVVAFVFLLASWVYIGYLGPTTEESDRGAESVAEGLQQCPATPAKPEVDVDGILKRAEDLLHEAIDAFRVPPVIFDDRELLYRPPPMGVPRLDRQKVGIT